MVSQFETFLRERGKRLTLERSAIVEKAISAEGHFDVEQLHAQLEKDSFHVSLATVYTTVDIMYEAGILRKHVFDGQARFEVAENNHLHLVCLQCGKIREIDDDPIVRPADKFNFPAFNVSYYTATFYGLCSSCSRKNKRARKAAADKKRNNN